MTLVYLEPSKSSYQVFTSINSRKNKQKVRKIHKMDTHDVDHVVVTDAEEVLLNSLLGTSTNNIGQIESMQTYASFIASD